MHHPRSLVKQVILMALFCGTGLNALAQAAAARPEESNRELREFQVVERGPHHRVWERIELVPTPDGGVVEQRRSYRELATGMHFKNERGEWEESEEKIEILPNDPGALAAKGQHKAIFPPELQSGLIELQTPDGVWLRSRIWGLAYFDAASGESVLLAEAKESEGQLADDNVVMYPDAFTEVRADVRYIYTRAGFEQDVVLRVKPPAPEAFGLDPDTTRLQVLTEFMTARTPNTTRRQTEGLPDDTLDFGAANIGIGKAFSVDANDQNSPEIPVAKQWKRIDERDFLIEEVWYEQVSEQLNKLPSAGRNEGASLLRRRGKGESVLAGLQPHLPKRFTETASPPAKPPRRMAKADYDPSLGFVMDYVMVNSSLTNYVFKGDTTYHVTGTVLLYGTNVIEGMRHARHHYSMKP